MGEVGSNTLVLVGIIAMVSEWNDELKTDTGWKWFNLSFFFLGKIGSKWNWMVTIYKLQQNNNICDSNTHGVWWFQNPAATTTAKAFKIEMGLLC
jgi:hypothetical protein